MREVDEYRASNRTCEVCGALGVHVHHIRTRGAGGTNSRINLISLCPVHHSEVHAIGRDTFGAKYGLTERFKRAMEVPRD